MECLTRHKPNDNWKFACFAAPLGAVGIPIYIYAPKFLIDHHGLSLWYVGTIFMVLRLADVIQDPLLGKLAEKIRVLRKYSVYFFVTMICLSICFFFLIDPFFNSIVYFCLCLFLMFTAFSYLSICFYSQGVSFVEMESENTHEVLAAWRETGALLGIVAACLLPAFFEFLRINPWLGFSVCLVVMFLCSTIVMRNSWDISPRFRSDAKLQNFLVDKTTLSFLILAFLNASPVAVTSTLFLFFVETRLEAVSLSGIFLLTFFVSAAASVPIWGKLSNHYEARRLLSIGMFLAVVTFGFTYFIGSGDILPFFIICGLSGASLGADMSILPAMYASHISKAGFESSVAFGLWNFFNKATLAVSAGIILPILAMSGFVSGKSEVEGQFFSLTFFYALLPCALKLLALIALNYGPFERTKS